MSAAENFSPPLDSNTTPRSNHCTPDGVIWNFGSMRSMFCCVLRSSRSSSVTLHSRSSFGYSRAKKVSTAFCPLSCNLPSMSGPLNPLRCRRARAARSEAASRVEYRVGTSGSGSHTPSFADVTPTVMMREP